MNDRCSQDRHKRASGLAAEPALSRAIQDRLGRELRDMYAEIQRDTVTGRLADLVRQLEHKDLTLRGRRRPPEMLLLRDRRSPARPAKGERNTWPGAPINGDGAREVSVHLRRRQFRRRRCRE